MKTHPQLKGKEPGIYILPTWAILTIPVVLVVTGIVIALLQGVSHV